MGGIGTNVQRKEALEKVAGTARYNADHYAPDLLHASLVTSLHAHARIRAIDSLTALKIPGVLAVVTGDQTSVMCGPILDDRPALARERVRYFGEPVAVVVARGEADAIQGVQAVKVEYEPLPVVNSVQDALKPGAPRLHEEMADYSLPEKEIYPEPGSNVGHRTRIRKGDMAKGWAEAEVVVEGSYSMPQIDHAALETRSVRAEIPPDGRILIHASSQVPYDIKKQISRLFHIEDGKVQVHTPLVGGAFGGKTVIQLEPLAVLASQAVGGRPVKLTLSREEDLRTAPVGTGVESRVRLGAKKDGTLVAAEFTHLMDAGAYLDKAPFIAKAMGQNCTGPYHVPNVWCDAVCLYTNHIFTTSLRGFGHTQLTFPVERSMEKLALALGMDPLELRRKNAILPGHTTPTQARLTRSGVGDLPTCIDRLKGVLNWAEGIRIQTGPRTVRAKGIGCFWKTPSHPPDVVSGAVLKLSKNGSVHLSVGAVELGQGTKTLLAQLVAERLQMNVEHVHVHMDVNTHVDPTHWKTVASMTTFMAGNAVLEAADSVIRQLQHLGGIALHCPPEALAVEGGYVYLKEDRQTSLEIKALAHGYSQKQGLAVGGQIIGTGQYIGRRLTYLDPETGKGKAGFEWTVGAQGVEVELDTEEWTYRILKAVSVIDAGKVLNPMGARGVVMGGMSMGLGWGSRESIIYGANGEMLNPQFRTYKTLRVGEQPEYLVDFVETPCIQGPYGARGFGEHGIIGMPAALANALSAAAGVELNQLPITPEAIWRAKGGAAQ